MDPFATALDALFHAPGSAAATFTPKGGVPAPDPIRVIRRQPDKAIGFGDGQIIEGTNAFEIRRSEVSEPKRGDQLKIGATTFKLLGDAMLDVEGMTWTIGGSALS